MDNERGRESKRERERGEKRLCNSDCNCGDNEAHFKVSAIECDLIYNPISIIIDDDVCARFGHAMNLHINTNLRRQQRLGQPNAKQSPLGSRQSAIGSHKPMPKSLAVFQGNRSRKKRTETLPTGQLNFTCCNCT